MTCIATDGQTLSADGRQTADGLIVSDKAIKLFHAKDGSAVGIAGNCASAVLARQWFEAGEDFGTIPKLEDKDFAALILRTDGRVQWMGVSFAAVDYEVPAAIGSGDEVAIGAMLAGKSPAEAVRIAATRVMSVGGSIANLGPKRPS
jgi:hypothetical protein